MNFLLLIGVVWLALTVMSRLAQRPDEVGRFLRRVRRWFMMLFTKPGWPSSDSYPPPNDTEWEVLEPPTDHNPPVFPNGQQLQSGFVWLAYLFLAILFLAVIVLLFLLVRPS